MEPRPLILKNATQEIIVVFIISMCQFLNQCGIQQCQALMNIIGDSFDNITPGQKSWFLALFPLAVGTFIMVSGKLGDIYGLKKVFLIGYAWLCFWSLIAGFSYYSKSIEFFIVCRAFQGLGFAMSFPCGLGILGLIYKTGLRKNIVFGVYALQAPTGASLGALFAGIVGQLYWWPWAFWLLAIALALLAVISFYMVPNVTPEIMLELERRESSGQSIALERDLLVNDLGIKRQMDWFGSSVGISGLVLFNFVWNQAPIAGWSNAYIIVLLVVSVILIVCFFYLELRVIKYPLLPHAVFKKDVAILLSTIALGWSSFGIWIFYYWTFMLNIKGYTPISTAAHMLPLLIMGVFAALIASFTIGKYVRAQILVFCSMVGFFVGIALLALTPAHQTYYKMIFASMFILAFGMDMSFPSAAISLSDYLPPEDQGLAGSIVSTIVNYSMSIGLGMGGTADAYVTKKGRSTLSGYRAAMYVGVGLAGLSVLLSFLFILKSYHDERVQKSQSQLVEDSLILDEKV